MDRFIAARKAGFEAVEFMLPYEWDVDEIKTRIDQTGMKLILFNFPGGNWAAGDRGIANDPRRTDEFHKEVEIAVTYSRKLGVSRLNCLAGTKLSSCLENESWQTLVANLTYAADVLREHGISLMVEPINRYDMPGFFINTTKQAMKLISNINRPNVYLQYDVYHAQRECEDLSLVLRNHLSRIGHIQIADAPGRHQPGTGQIDYKSLLHEIDRSGYHDYVSMEYIPEPDTLTSLKWVKEAGYRLGG